MRRGALRLLGRYLLVTAFFNVSALAIPAYYIKSSGWPPGEGPGLLALYLYVIASSSLICALAFYFLVARRLELINGKMNGLCRKIESHPIVERRGDELAVLQEGLECMARQWESSRLELEETTRQEFSKMEKLATIGEMAFSVAHDIKNPLAGISGAIQVFSEDFPEDDPRGEIVREILGEIARLDRTVKDLQCYARPPRPHPVPIPVYDLLEMALRHMDEIAKKSSVDVNIVKGSDDLEVNVDAEQLLQVMINIMDFSIKTMPDGGTLSLDASVLSDREHIEITLKDTGTGLKSENMDTLFKPFRMSRMSPRGLSMAISRDFVEMNGGSIKVESSPGTGTTFKVVLPVYRNNA